MSKIDTKKAVYKLQNGKLLTKQDFVKYFEDKVFKTIRKFEMLNFEDRVVVALSGGKDSITALYLIHKYMSKKNLQDNITALLIDEGIKGYRPPTIDFAQDFCDKLGIKLEVKSYKKEFGSTQDNNVLKLKDTNISPCNVCGTFRRTALNKGARDLKATKLVTGHNADDESQNILLNVFKNNFKILARLGPKTGILKDKKFVPRIKPLYFCTEKEVRLYTIIKGFDVGFDECPYSRGSFRDNLGEIINKLEDEHKGVKHSILNFYLEIQEEMQKKYVEDHENEVSFCTRCGEPSQKVVCNTCELKDLVNN